MKIAKLVSVFLFICFLANCTKDESTSPKQSIEEQSKTTDSIIDDTDTEVTKDSITEIPTDSIPETPIDSIPEIPIDSIPDIPIDSTLITYFTYNVSIDLLGAPKEDHGIMIHDKEGELLEYKTFETGDYLIFQSIASKKPDDFTVTTFFRSTARNGNEEYYDFETYPNITSGSIWTFLIIPRSYTDNIGDPIGSFNVAISNLTEEFERFSLSSNHETRTLGNYTTENGLKTLNLDNVGVYENNSFILTTVDNENRKKYIEINNVQAGDDLIFDYDEFRDFDHTINIQLPSNIGLLNLWQHGGTEPQQYQNQTYSLEDFHWGQSDPIIPETISLSFNDNLKTYLTQINLDSEEFSYYYYKHGTKTDNLTINKPDYSVLDESLFNFSFNTNVGFITRLTGWSAAVNNGGKTYRTQWGVLSKTNSNPKLNQLPEEIQATFPNLNINDLQNRGTILNLRGESYEKLISNKFINHQDTYNREYEAEYYSIRN